jgi:hypothetical protein
MTHSLASLAILLSCSVLPVDYVGLHSRKDAFLSHMDWQEHKLRKSTALWRLGIVLSMSFFSSGSPTVWKADSHLSGSNILPLGSSLLDLILSAFSPFIPLYLPFNNHPDLFFPIMLFHVLVLCSIHRRLCWSYPSIYRSCSSSRCNVRHGCPE